MNIEYLLGVAEMIIFAHGSIVTYSELDANDSGELEYHELAAARLARALKDFDEDNDGDLDLHEYSNMVDHKIVTDENYLNDMIDEYAFQMDHTDLNMGSDKNLYTAKDFDEAASDLDEAASDLDEVAYF